MSRSDRDAALLAAYADGLLRPVERRALEERLDADPALAAQLARVRAGRDRIRGAARAARVPEALRDRLVPPGG
jgi:anti-sigma factor RsiW